MKKPIKPGEIEVTHVKGSGPGGQNRNKRWTGIRVKHVPTGIVARATVRRSQNQNLQDAFESLEQKLEVFHYKPPKRHATRPSRSSVQRRQDAKRRHASKKKDRRKGWQD